MSISTTLNNHPSHKAASALRTKIGSFNAQRAKNTAEVRPEPLKTRPKPTTEETPKPKLSKPEPNKIKPMSNTNQNSMRAEATEITLKKIADIIKKFKGSKRLEVLASLNHDTLSKMNNNIEALRDSNHDLKTQRNRKMQIFHKIINSESVEDPSTTPVVVAVRDPAGTLHRARRRANFVKRLSFGKRSAVYRVSKTPSGKTAFSEESLKGSNMNYIEEFFNLIDEGFSDSEISSVLQLDESKTGKVDLSKLRTMSSKERKEFIANMKSAATVHQNKKATAKLEPKKETEPEKEPEASGLDLITQHSKYRQIKSVLATIKHPEHKKAAVNWLMDAIKNKQNNKVSGFLSNPLDTVTSIVRDNSKPKKSGPTLAGPKWSHE